MEGRRKFSIGELEKGEAGLVLERTKRRNRRSSVASDRVMYLFSVFGVSDDTAGVAGEKVRKPGVIRESQVCFLQVANLFSSH